MLTKYKDLFVIDNGFINCSIDVNGGRIVSFKKDKKEFLSTKEINPAIYGSTLWPAPQSIWNWPPPSKLDEIEYDININDNRLLLISQNDDVLNMRFTKEFVMTDNNLEINYNIRNISIKNVKVSPWEVTRVNKGGIAFFPRGENEVWGSNLDLMKIKVVNNIVWYTSEEKIYTDHTKLFNNGKEGWLAYIQDGYVFIKQFEELQHEFAAPEEDGIEIYANPIDNYIELENLGKYEEIKPGKEINYKVKWYIEQIEKSISVNAGNIKLVDFVRKTIFN